MSGPGEHEETAARALAKRLTGSGVAARAEGAGVHWHVEAGSPPGRAVIVHCFWYQQAVSGLMLGMNPGNARHRPRGRRQGYGGPEYLVILHDHGVQVVDGRTRDEVDAAVCAQRWLAGTTLDDLARELPFVDQKPRAMRALAGRLPRELRWDIEPEPGCALWVYSDGRSCRLAQNDDGVSLACLLGQAEVAWSDATAELPDAVTAWLIDRVPVAQLAMRVPGLELERHVELIEREPARWHWQTVRDRLNDPNDVLAPSRGLIEALAASPIASAFYSYSSMSWFCFSVSSHYPWVDEGLPRLLTLPDGRCTVDDVPYEPAAAIERIEPTLGAYPVRPFFGSAVHRELLALTACLQRQGSVLVPALVQRGAWYRVEIARGDRRCELSGGSVRFIDGAHDGQAFYRPIDDAVPAVLRFLEDRAPLDAVLEQRPPPASR